MQTGVTVGPACLGDQVCTLTTPSGGVAGMGWEEAGCVFVGSVITRLPP